MDTQLLLMTCALANAVIAGLCWRVHRQLSALNIVFCALIVLYLAVARL